MFELMQSNVRPLFLKGKKKRKIYNARKGGHRVLISNNFFSQLTTTIRTQRCRLRD